MIEDRYNPVRMTRKELDEFFDGFVEALDQKQPATKETYERALREFRRWFFRDRRCRFLVEDIERYKAYLMSARRMTNVSVSTYLTALRRFCQYLVEVGALQRNPAKRVHGIRRPPASSPESLSQEELDRLFSSVNRSKTKGARDYAIMRLMSGCGLSEKEIVQADVKDIRRTGNHWSIFVQGKSRDKKGEDVLLSDDAKEAIDEYLARREEYSPEEPLCLSMAGRSHGRRMTTRGVREFVNRYLELSGIKRGRTDKITPYSLRHTAGVIMAESGNSLDEVRRRMRFVSISSAKNYVHHKGKPAPPQKSISRR
jgi:site-specific recombinase XerD